MIRQRPMLLPRVRSSSMDITRLVRRRKLRSWAILTVVRCAVGATLCATIVDSSWWWWTALLLALLTIGGFLRATEDK